MSANSPKESTIEAINISVSPTNKCEKKKKKKKKKKTCNHDECRKKLRLTDLPCRCSLRFCNLHRLPETHSCSFNFNNETDIAFMKRVGLGGGEVCKMEVI